MFVGNESDYQQYFKLAIDQRQIDSQRMAAVEVSDASMN